MGVLYLGGLGLGLLDGLILLTGLERQRLGELNRDFFHKGIAMLYPANEAAAYIVFHIKRVILTVFRNAESCDYILTFAWTGIAVARKSRSAA